MRLLPLAKGCGRLNRDSLFSFQFHAVHFCADTILATNIVNGINSSRVKQDSFGEGCLSTVNVCTDPDVSQDPLFVAAHPSGRQSRGREYFLLDPRPEWTGCESKQSCHCVRNCDLSILPVGSLTSTRLLEYNMIAFLTILEKLATLIPTEQRRKCDRRIVNFHLPFDHCSLSQRCELNRIWRRTYIRQTVKPINSNSKCLFTQLKKLSLFIDTVHCS